MHSSPLHFPDVELTSRIESPECDVIWEGSKEKGNWRKKQLELGQCLLSVALWESHIMHLKRTNHYETIRKPHLSARVMTSQFSTSQAIPDQSSAPVVRTRRSRRSPCRPRKDFMAQAEDQNPQRKWETERVKGLICRNRWPQLGVLNWCLLQHTRVTNTPSVHRLKCNTLFRC